MKLYKTSLLKQYYSKYNSMNICQCSLDICHCLKWAYDIILYEFNTMFSPYESVKSWRQAETRWVYFLECMFMKCVCICVSAVLQQNSFKKYKNWYTCPLIYPKKCYLHKKLICMWDIEFSYLYACYISTYDKR